MLSSEYEKARQYIQPNPARFQTDNQHFWFSGGRFELGNGCIPPFDIHGTIKSVLVETLSLQDYFDEIQKAGELRKDHGSKARILVSKSS